MLNTFEENKEYPIIQKAELGDLHEIRKFTDFWLAGRGKAKGTPGAVNDCFISPSQHTKYLRKYDVFVVRHYQKIVGWSVTQHDSSLIHFLIAGDYRKQGLGSWFLEFLNPQKIHSKSDQSSGNPSAFYEKHGYKKTRTVKSKSRLDIDKIRPNRKANIDIYEKIT